MFKIKIHFKIVKKNCFLINNKMIKIMGVNKNKTLILNKIIFKN